MAFLRNFYARLRQIPILGGIVSRLVWGTKGLLGRPVAIAAPAPPAGPPAARPPPRGPAADLRLRLALQAAEALQTRLAALERAAADVTPDRPGPAAERPHPLHGAAPASWSVVIPTLDRAAWLERALWGLAYQTHPAFEVIVVCGPCRDQTPAVLARHGVRVRVVACAEANISAARNAGVAAAGGEAIAFLDDDAVPEPDWLERLGEVLADPGVAGVGGFIRDATGVAFQCRTVVADRFGGSQDLGERGRRLDPPGAGVARYLSLTGVNSAFRREALLAIGGFDTAFAYFLDETDVCLRLVEAGWRLATAPAAEVHHACAASPQRDATGVPRRLIDCARSTAYFSMRHAAPHHGLAATVERLNTYAAGLAHDTAWRAEHGVVSPADAERMLREIEGGVLEGARMALSGPAALAVRRPGAVRQPTMSPGAIARSPPVLKPSSERLKLALLCQDYPGVAPPERPPGGIAVWTSTLAEALARRGHEVSVFARTGDATSTVRFETLGGDDGGGLWVHRVSMASMPARAGRGLLAGAPTSVAGPAQAQAAEVTRVAPRRRFELALGPVWDLEPAALLGRAPFPVGVSLHTACAQIAADRPDWSDAYRRSHVDRVIAAERRLLAAAPHLLSNSATALGDLAAAVGLPDLAERATVLPHGLPDLAAGVTPARRAAGVEFLFVGRFERRKGVDTVLEAAPVVLAADPSLRLTLVGEETGDGSTAETFRRSHAGAPWLARVAFPGPLPRPALLARYAACDAVLMPSRYESFGLVALEAMIFARPCIAGDAGGLRDLVVEDETGMRVPPGDAAALARAILALAAAPERRAAMGAAARRRFLAHYTDEAMADGFEGWARAVTGRRARLLAAE